MYISAKHFDGHIYIFTHDPSIIPCDHNRCAEC